MCCASPAPLLLKLITATGKICRYEFLGVPINVITHGIRSPARRLIIVRYTVSARFFFFFSIRFTLAIMNLKPVQDLDRVLVGDVIRAAIRGDWNLIKQNVAFG